MKKTLIVHPFLFAIFPVLALCSCNVSQVSIGQVFAPLVISLSATVFAFILLGLRFKDRMKLALFLSLFLMLFFSFGYLYDIFGNYKIIIIFDAVIFALCAYFIVKTKRNLEGFTAFMNLVFAILLIAPLTNIVSHTLESRNSGVKIHAAKPQAINASDAHISQYPNIYYIILDAYARQDVLNDIYGFDNSEFINYLTGKGFYVAKNSRSNYTNTHESLASSLNLDYINDWVKTNEDTMNVKRNNLADRFLEGRGYRIKTIFATPDIISSDDNGFLIKGFTLNEFDNMLMNTTPLPALLKCCKIYDPFDLYRRKINYGFEYLSDSCKMNSPFFIFIHIGAPHPPFVFGRNGESINAAGYFSANDGFRLVRKGRLTEAEYHKYYIDQLVYVNKRIMEALDNILSKSAKPPIIIIQGDHGPRSMLKSWDLVEAGNLDEEVSILSAYCLPGKGKAQLYDAISPVNTFRVVFNEYFNTHYALLKDRSYFAPPVKTFYSFTDVTDKLKK